MVQLGYFFYYLSFRIWEDIREHFKIINSSKQFWGPTFLNTSAGLSRFHRTFINNCYMQEIISILQCLPYLKHQSIGVSFHDGCSELPVISVAQERQSCSWAFNQGWLTSPPHYTSCAGVWPVSNGCVCYHLWYQLRLGGIGVRSEVAKIGWCESVAYPQ